MIDSLRFRLNIARELGVRMQDVQAQIIGEHGNSGVFVWPSATVAGALVLGLLKQRSGDTQAIRTRIESAVKFGNIATIGASQHGIGAVVGRIAEHIVGNSQAVLPVPSRVEQFGTTISVPSIVGRSGVTRTLLLQLSSDERQALDQSAEILRKAAWRLSLTSPIRARDTAEKKVDRPNEILVMSL